MKNLILFLLFIPCFVLAQSLEYKFGKPYEPATIYYTKLTFSEPETGNIVIFRERNFEIIDKNTLTLKKAGSLDGLPKWFGHLATLLINNKFYFVYQYWDKTTKITTFFLGEIDLAAGKIKENPKKLLEFTKDKTPHGFSILQLIGDDRFAVICRSTPKSRDDGKNYNEYGIHIFNYEFDSLLSSNITMPYTERAMDNLRFLIDKNNNFILLANVRADGSEDNIKNSKINFRIEVLRFDLKAKTVKIAKLEAENLPLISLQGYKTQVGALDNDFFIDESGVIKCVAFYDETAKKTALEEGIVVFEINPDNNVKTHIHKIPLSIIEQYQNKSNSGKLEMLLMRFHNLVLLEDNSFILIGEKHYQSYDSKGNPDKYFLEDILVTKISANGELVWMKKIPKRGERKGLYSTTTMLVTKNNIHFFCWDNPDNLSVPTNQAPSRYLYETAALIVCSIDKNTGEFEKKSVFKTNEKKGGYELLPFKVESIVPFNGTSALITMSYTVRNEMFLFTVTPKNN